MRVVLSATIRAAYYQWVSRFVWRLWVIRSVRNLDEDTFRKMVPDPSFAGNVHLADDVGSPEFISILTSLCGRENILREAEEVLQNRFTGLGMVSEGLGWPLPWNSDFRNGVHFPLIPSHTIRFSDLPEGDPKYPWELARFHQVWPLGKAYLLTGDICYAEKLHALLSDFLSKNPLGFGIHWMEPIEASIRAANLLSAWYLFKDFSPLRSLLPRVLFQHGIFIEWNLEFTRRSGNHLLANLSALSLLGRLFKGESFGGRWMRLSKKHLEREVLRQHTDDGVNYEKSFSYHVFVLEMLCSVLSAARNSDAVFSSPFMERFRSMTRFYYSFLRPDGSCAQIGDSDDGSFHRFSTEPLLPSRLVPFLHARLETSLPVDVSEHLLWLDGISSVRLYRKHRDHLLADVERRRSSSAVPPMPMSDGFPQGGFYILRSHNSHVSIDAGDLGKNGWGGHGHNDTFGFEFWADGLPLIIDRGTYCYLGNREMRNTFRSTTSHNSVVVDGKEIADFVGPFLIKDTTDPRIIKWNRSDRADYLEAVHHGYKSLPSPIIHRRIFRFEKPREYLTLEDILDGSGEHILEYSLYLGPDVIPRVVNETAVLLESGVSEWTVSFHKLMPSIEKIDFSPSYGKLQPTWRIYCRIKVLLPFDSKIHIFRSSKNPVQYFPETF